LIHNVFLVDDSVFLEYLKSSSPYIFILDRFFFELSEGSFGAIVTDQTLKSVEEKVKRLSEGESEENRRRHLKYVDWIKTMEHVEIHHVSQDLLKEAIRVSDAFSVDIEDAINIVYAEKLDAMALFLKPTSKLKDLKSLYNGRITFLSNIYFAGGGEEPITFWWY